MEVQPLVFQSLVVIMLVLVEEVLAHLVVSLKTVVDMGELEETVLFLQF